MPNTTTQPGNSKKNPASVHCSKFNVSRLSYTELETDNDRNKAQMIAYPRYRYQNAGGDEGSEGSFVFQTDWITLSQYGLPKKGKEVGDFYMDDKDRTFLKVPLDDTQASCVHLRKMLSEIDNYNTSNKSKIFKNLGSKGGLGNTKNAAQLFTYQPTIRSPQSDDEFGQIDENSKKGASGDNKQPKLQYCKMQFSTSYPEKHITTSVFMRESVDKDPVEFQAKTASDLENGGLIWGSQIRMIVMVNKLWAAKAKNQAGSRGYGVTMKIMQLEVIPRQKSSSTKEQFSRYAFISDDEDDQGTESKTPSKSNTQTAKGGDDEGGDDENENEEENEGDEDDNENAQNADGDEEEEEGEGDDNDNDNEDEEEDEEEVEEQPAPKSAKGGAKKTSAPPAKKTTKSTRPATKGR